MLIPDWLICAVLLLIIVLCMMLRTAYDNLRWLARQLQRADRKIAEQTVRLFMHGDAVNPFE